MLDSKNWLVTFQEELNFSPLAPEAYPPDERTARAAFAQQNRQALLASIAMVEEFLDGKKAKRNMAYEARFFGYPRGRAVVVEGKELRQLEQLATRLFTARGAGRTDVEEALLGHIALSADPTSLPFYRAAIAANRTHDMFAPKRRRMAVAAIAFLAMTKNCPEAHAALRSYLDHADPAMRGEAVDHFAQLHLTKKGQLKSAAAETVAAIARDDRAFGPRFIARQWLARTGQAVPLDYPDGVYAFRAALGRASFTIELTATQTLGQLAGAIVSAFGWDHDHLYEFAMTNDLRDRRFVLPPGDEPGLPLEFARPTGKRKPSVLELPLGTLGLTKEHRFIFRFDFGDDHRFQVVVAAIHPRKEPRTRYPRVVAHTGRPPAQYRWE